MEPRTCIIRLWISNGAGEESRYSLKPLPPVQLAQSVAAFRLVNLSRDPAPVYTVRLALSGQATCDCPQNQFCGECKHADALTAAGVLPVAIIGVLQTRTALLDQAEAMLRETAAKLADAEAQLAAVSTRAVQLQNAALAQQSASPKRRRAKAAA